MSIASLVLRCLGIFDSLTATDSALEELHRLRLGEEQGRFRIWAGNLSAHRPTGRRSLEYRLRDSHNLKERVLSITKDLREELESLTETSFRATEASEASEDEGSAIAFEYDDAMADPAEEVLQAIHDIINTLYRFSLTLKNPAGHSHIRETLNITAAARQPHEVSHVRDKFPQCSANLAERLGQAMSTRRQYLRYREHRHEMKTDGLFGKRAKNTEDTITATSVPKVLEVDAFAVKDEIETVYSETSYALSEHDLTGLRPPPLPKEGLDGKPFLCPICYDLVSCPTDRAWKRHVFEDVPPYICTYHGCTAKIQLYSSRRDWQRHETKTHCALWSCPYECGFSAEDSNALEQHLGAVHKRSYSKSAFSKVKQANTQSRIEAKDLNCPLCLKLCGTVAKWYKHVGHHQEQLALFCVSSADPESEGSQGEEENVSDSGSESISEASEADDTAIRATFDGQSEDQSHSIETDGQNNPGEAPGSLHDVANELEDLKNDQGESHEVPSSVSTLAKHFEQMSREFETERRKERGEDTESQADLVGALEISHDDEYSTSQESHSQLVDTNSEIEAFIAPPKYEKNAELEELKELLEKRVEDEDKDDKDKNPEIDLLKELIEKHEEERIAHENVWIAEREAEAAAKAAEKDKVEEEKKREVEIDKAKREAKAERKAEEAAKEAKEDHETKLENKPHDFSKAPIRFKDAVGRKFNFPWHICNHWNGMETLIKQAFLNVDTIGEHVHQGHYDLTGPDGEIILPQVWDAMIQPGLEVTMHLWPMDMPGASSDNHASRDYEMQLMLLEQQNKKRLRLAREAQNSLSDQALDTFEGGSEDTASIQGKAAFDIRDSSADNFASDVRISKPDDKAIDQVTDEATDMEKETVFHASTFERPSQLPSGSPHGSAEWQLAEREAQLRDLSSESRRKEEEENLRRRIRIEQLEAEAKREPGDARDKYSKDLLAELNRKEDEAKARQKAVEPEWAERELKKVEAESEKKGSEIEDVTMDRNLEQFFPELNAPPTPSQIPLGVPSFLGNSGTTGSRLGWINRAPTTRTSMPTLKVDTNYLPPPDLSRSRSPSPASSTGSYSRSRKTQMPFEDMHCHYCNAAFDTQGDLTHHLRSHQPYLSRNHVCTKCNKRFQYRKDLMRHLPRHDPNRPKFYCPVNGCKYNTKGFGRQDHLDRHFYTQHDPNSTSHGERSKSRDADGRSDPEKNTDRSEVLESSYGSSSQSGTFFQQR